MNVLTFLALFAFGLLILILVSLFLFDYFMKTLHENNGSFSLALSKERSPDHQEKKITRSSVENREGMSKESRMQY